jgi:hypothetical protein
MRLWRRRLGKALDALALDSKIHATGWYFCFMAAEVKVMFLGAIGTNLQKALQRMLKKLKSLNFNCLEVTGMVAKRFLGCRTPWFQRTRAKYNKVAGSMAPPNGGRSTPPSGPEVKRALRSLRRSIDLTRIERVDRLLECAAAVSSQSLFRARYAPISMRIGARLAGAKFTLFSWPSSASRATNRQSQFPFGCHDYIMQSCSATSCSILLSSLISKLQLPCVSSSTYTLRIRCPDSKPNIRVPAPLEECGQF